MLSSLFVLIACFSPSETIKNGEWSIENIKTTADSCNVGRYHNLRKMAPSKFDVLKSSSTYFFANEVECTINQHSFVCKPIYLTSPALHGAAKIKVKTVMDGKIKSNSFMKLKFGITLESCRGFGCFFIKKVLDFPCLANLEAEGKI